MPTGPLESERPSARRAPRPSGRLWLALASAILVALGAGIGLPRLQAHQQRARARDSAATIIDCLLGDATPDSSAWTRRMVAASDSRGDGPSPNWPECCRAHLGVAKAALRQAAIASSRCDRTCCVGDRACAAFTQLFGHLLRIETDPLGELDATTIAQLRELGRALAIEPAKPSACGPPAAKPMPLDVELEPIVTDFASSPIGRASDGKMLPFEVEGESGSRSRCSLPLSGDARVTCAAAALDPPLPRIDKAVLGPVSALDGFVWAEDDHGRWRIMAKLDGDAVTITTIDVLDRALIRGCRTPLARVLFVGNDPMRPGQESLVAIERDGRWHTHRVAVAPAAGFTCHGDRASFLAITALGGEKLAHHALSHHALERVTCAARCERERAEITLTTKQTGARVLVGDLGDGVAVFHQGRFGELRSIVAPLTKLAESESVALGDSLDGGRSRLLLAGAQLFVHDGVGVLLLMENESKRRRLYGLRVTSTDPKIEPYHR
jgi:hypothetical protein